MNQSKASLLTEPINLSANAFMLGAFADILISSIPKLTRLIYLRTVSEFYQDKMISHSIHYSMNNWEKQPIFISVFFKMAGALEKMLFAFWYCGLLTLQKTSVFFGSYFSIALQTKISLPGRQARSKADNPVWIIFFIWSGYYACSIWRNIEMLLKSWVCFKTWEL